MDASHCFLFSVMSPPDASACRTATCSSSLFQGSTGTFPVPFLHLSSSPLSDSLSLSDSVLVCIHRGFSRQGSLNNRSVSFSELILTWFCRFSLQSLQCISRTTSNMSVNSPRTPNVHISRPRRTPPKFNERTSKRERRKKENCGGRGKKREMLGPPFAGPTLRGAGLKGSPAPLSLVEGMVGPKD